jgi:hypothetical protein
MDEDKPWHPLVIVPLLEAFMLGRWRILQAIKRLVRTPTVTDIKSPSSPHPNQYLSDLAQQWRVQSTWRFLSSFICLTEYYLNSATSRMVQRTTIQLTL